MMIQRRIALSVWWLNGKFIIIEYIITFYTPPSTSNLASAAHLVVVHCVLEGVLEVLSPSVGLAAVVQRVT